MCGLSWRSNYRKQNWDWTAELFSLSFIRFPCRLCLHIKGVSVKVCPKKSVLFSFSDYSVLLSVWPCFRPCHHNQIHQSFPNAQKSLNLILVGNFPWFLYLFFIIEPPPALWSNSSLVLPVHRMASSAMSRLKSPASRSPNADQKKQLVKKDCFQFFGNFEAGMAGPQSLEAISHQPYR